MWPIKEKQKQGTRRNGLAIKITNELLLKNSGTQFPTYTWQLTKVSHISSRGPTPSSDFCGTRNVYGVHTYMQENTYICMQANTYVHKIKFNKLRKTMLTWESMYFHLCKRQRLCNWQVGESNKYTFLRGHKQNHSSWRGSLLQIIKGYPTKAGTSHQLFLLRGMASPRSIPPINSVRHHSHF